MWPVYGVALFPLIKKNASFALAPTIKQDTTKNAEL